MKASNELIKASDELIKASNELIKASNEKRKLFVLYGGDIVDTPEYFDTFKATQHPLNKKESCYKDADYYKTFCKTVMLDDSTEVELVVIGFQGFSLKNTPIPIELPAIDLFLVPRMGETLMIDDDDTFNQEGSHTKIEDLKKINKGNTFDYTSILELSSLKNDEKSQITKLLSNRPTVSDSPLVSDTKTSSPLTKEEVHKLINLISNHQNAKPVEVPSNDDNRGCNIF